MQITLVNYPLLSFTQQELLDFQRKGVDFKSNPSVGSASFYSGRQKFDSVGVIDYQVAPSTYNLSLFEKLAGIPPKKTPRKHHELIKAWAEDATVVIQHWSNLFDGWRDVVENKPLWSEDTTYRIKPTEPTISEQTLKDIQQGLTTGIATCLGMLLLKEEI